MKKFNKILCLLLALAMMLSLVACGGGSNEATDAPATDAPVADGTNAGTVEYVDPYADLAEDYDALSSAVYNDVLGEFYSYYQVAKEATNVSERHALMAIAEAKLMEAAVMLPLYSSGGVYALSRIAPYSISPAKWGYDSSRYHDALVTTVPLTTEARDEMKAKWGELAGTGEYEAWAKSYLADNGYELKDTLAITYGTDPISWDCLATSRATEGEACANIWDGLIEYDVENVMQPALAESWSVSEDGLTYTFNIRQGVKWVDSQGRELGEVTADDWVAGMQHALDSMGGLEYLVQGIIKGVNEYINGDITDFAEVGVKAVDTYTLEYTLEAPTSFFMTMLNYSIFSPLNRSYYESQGGKFGADYDASAADYTFATTADNVAYCGPYVVSNHTAENTIVFSANPSYWNKDNIEIQTITWLYNDGSDPTKAINDMMNGVIDSVSLNSATIEVAKSTNLPEGYTSAKGATNWYDEFKYVSNTTATSYMAFFNIHRIATANAADGAVPTNKTAEDIVRSNAALKNVHFRRALAYSVDRASYNAQFSGEELKLNSLRNTYVPGDFITLAEEVTVDINGTATTYPAGTLYGAIMQDQIDADGVDIQVWDPNGDAGRGSTDGFDGWYNPEAAAAELATAVEELAAIGIEVSAENPIYIDYPFNTASSTRTNGANAVKQAVEAATGGAIIINLVQCVDANEWYYTGYYTDFGYEANYEFFDLSGWGPDYGDPQTYLDTFQPDYAGYMLKCVGLF